MATVSPSILSANFAYLGEDCRKALERRSEIAPVNMRSGCITAEYRPEFCRQLQSHAGETALDIRLKGINVIKLRIS